MKKILQSFILLLFACGLLGGLPSAWATHIQGGQMTYRYISGDTYEITVSFYRDCSPGASTLPTSVSIRAASSCSATGISATLLPVAGSLTTGIGYCPSIQALATCNPAQPNFPNYEKQDFRGTISLPPAANWIISYDDCCRPSTGNIPTQDNFRFEATLNNLVTVNGVATRVNNTSPLFSARDIPVPFVIVNQRTSINFTSALEPDGDSLVYELDRPLSTCGVYNPYAPRVGNTTACNSGPLPAAPGTVCFLNCASSQGSTFTADNPLPVAVDTVGFCGTVGGQVYYKTVRPRFQLDPTNGQITFTPNLFRPGNTNLGLNKYVVVGKITEYRRLTGSNRRYRVGSVRRDFLVIVIEGAGNTVPTPPVVSVPDPASGAVPTNTVDTTRIIIQTCNYAQVRVNFTDPDNFATSTHPASNPLQNLSVTYTGNGTINNDLLLNGDIGTYTLINNGSPTPEARFYFQPSPSFAGQTIRIPLRIEDNACPVKGIQTRIIEIKIVRGNFAQAVAAVGNIGIGNQTPSSICPGGTLQLRGTVIRPDSIRRLANNTTTLQVYGYQWTAVGSGNGLPAVTNTQNIAVNPTVTTRYLLRIIPTLGFAQGACSDTSSIVVRVVPEPVATATATLTQVCAGAAVTLRGSATRPTGLGSNLNDTYSYRWSGPGIANNTTTQNVTVNPTALGVNTYTLTVNGAAPYGCDATTTVQVTVVPPPTLTTLLSIANVPVATAKVCAGAPVVLRVRARRPTGAGSTLTDTYTFAWTGPSIVGTSTDSVVTVRPTARGLNNYSVTVTGSTQFNCSAVATAQVEVVAPPTVRAVTNNTYICPGGTATLQGTATSASLTDTYTYAWTGTGLPAGSTGATLTVRPTVTTRYLLTATGSAQYGCSDTASVVVRVTPAVVASFTTADSVGLNGQRTNRPPVIFTFRNATVTNPAGQSPTATVSYAWTYQRVRDIASVGVSEPVTAFGGNTATPAPLQLSASGYYIIRLTTTATVGGAACASSTASKTVLVPDLQVPNVITPNGDGLNDVFKVSTVGTSSKMEIFNRWGRKVYEQAGYQNNWGGDNQPAGVYYYMLTTTNGAQTKGWIEIVR